MNSSPRIGIDFGGTKAEAISLSAEGEVEASTVVPTVPGIEGVLGVAESLITTLVEATGREVRDYAGVGIGIPGQVDRATGEVRNAYNMGLTSLALAGLLGARVGVPVSLDNDVTAAAAGAAHLLKLPGTIVYLNLGTGLAAGIIVEGQPIRGAHGYAGEIGHLPVSPLGRRCPCGQHGCLETVASGSALKAHWDTPGDRSGRALLAAVEAGDPAAREAFDLLIDGAASAIRILGLTLNPDAIVIGGGLRLLGVPLLDAIHTKLRGWATESEFLAALELNDRLQVLPEESPTAAVGAALAATPHTQ